MTDTEQAAKEVLLAEPIGDILRLELLGTGRYVPGQLEAQGVGELAAVDAVVTYVGVQRILNRELLH